MKCPRCKCDDVYSSRSGNIGILSILMTAVRCHRCCYQFSVLPWTYVPKKSVESVGQRDSSRRAA